MSCKDFLTYSEYKLFCYKHGRTPLRREETGPFIRDIKVRERPREDLSEVFAFLCSQDGAITGESIRGHIRKFGLNEEAIMELFEVLGQDQITIKEFCGTFGG